MTLVAARRISALAMAIVVATLCGVSACGPSAQRPYEIRGWTDNYTVRVTSDPMPPRARERIIYKIVVRDKKTGQPIENGEGRVFATSRDRANTWDSLEPGPEIGTYYGHLHFITAGDWAVAMQFRRDSLHPLEKVEWTQEVRNARESATP